MYMNDGNGIYERFNIHLNSQGALSDVVLNKVKKNANLMI